MCNCRFPNGKDYIINYHGPAPTPGACAFCGKRCWLSVPCAKYKQARGVAAPLEPTPLTPEQFYLQRHPKQPYAELEPEAWLEFAEAYAAAVSKAKDDKIAELRARISELEKELRLDWKPYIL